jgi:hypothetical protein
MDTSERILTGLVLGLAALIWAWWIIKGRKWIKKCKRRRGGVYLVRTRKHRLGWRPRWWPFQGRRENGYVGETVSHHLRQKDHRGTGRNGQKAQPWSDLDPIWHCLNLPWWLCWKWILRPLETLAILFFAPRYNDAKNHWNPRRIPLSLAKRQRWARDEYNTLTAGLRRRAGYLSGRPRV